MSTSPAADLARLMMFRDIAPAHLERLAGAGRLVHFSPGQRLYRLAEPAVGSALLVLHGRLEVTLPGAERPINTIRPGDVVGEAALFSRGGKRSADVVATTAGRALEITPAMMAKIALNPATARLERYLLASLARRIRHTTLLIQRAQGRDDAGAPPAPGGSLLDRLRSLFGV